MADSAPEKSESVAQRGRAVLESENFLDFIDLLEQHQMRPLRVGVKLVSKPNLIELEKLAGRLQDLSDIERLGGGRQR